MGEKTLINRAKRMESTDALVLGAGISGIGAARVLAEEGFKTIVMEQESEVGGNARTFKRDGFLYDLGPHFPAAGLAKALDLRGSCRDLSDFEAIWIQGKSYRYPLGLLKNAGFLTTVGKAYLKGLLSKSEAQRDTLEHYLEDAFGVKFFIEVLKPLVEKWAGVPVSQLSSAVVTRLDPPSLEVLHHHLIIAVARKDSHWVYPDRGIGWMCQEAARGLDVRTNSRVVRLVVERDKVRCVEIQGGRFFEPKAVISTLPLDTLVKIAPELSLDFGTFRYRALVLLYLRFRCERLSNRAWYWLPEPSCPFYRISEMKVIRNSYAPAAETLLTVEIPCQVDDEVWAATCDTLLEQCLPWIEKIFPRARGRFKEAWVHKLTHAYPIFHNEYEHKRRLIGHRTPIGNLFFAGRYGLFRYMLMEECFRDASECSREVATYLKRLR
jgi:protoporphyrinogen oxidase